MKENGKDSRLSRQAREAGITTLSTMCRDTRRTFLCFINYARDAGTERREVVLLRDGTARARQNFPRDRHPPSGEGRVIFMQSKGYRGEDGGEF